MCGPKSICVHVTCVCEPMGVRRVTNPLELEVQTVVSGHVGALEEQPVPLTTELPLQPSAGIKYP